MRFTLKRTVLQRNGVKIYMAPPKKVDNHEIPDLTELESENIVVHKKSKGREKQPFTVFEAESKDRQPESKE